MMILIPMAGAGARFAEAGYKEHKPAISTLDYRDGKRYPMVVCATRDLPGVKPDGSNVIYVDRKFHKESGVENQIKEFYPKATFITIEELTEGQACTCLMAKSLIYNDEELLIAGCDNGMLLDGAKFNELRSQSDVVVFTYTHNQSVKCNPNAYGYMIPGEDNRVVDLSIKKTVSEHPENDHAVVATFWYKKGRYFVEAAEKMIAENDRINKEFYVDETVKHSMELGHIVRIFDIERYIGWGTPKDYEDYMRAFEYWRTFVENENFLLQK